MTSDNSEKMLVSFWGTRGSVSTPGRMTEKYGGNTPCVGVRCGDIQIVFDAGTGIRNLGIELLEEINNTEKSPLIYLFLSHTHWDHIQGLPFFQPSYNEKTKLTILGSPRKELFLESILKEQMGYEYFPVSMSAFSAEINIMEITDKSMELGPMQVGWQEQVCHPGGSVRYSVSLDGRKVVYATDVELDGIFNSENQSDQDKDLAKEYMDFICDADLLIADAQYTVDEYPEKIGWGHSSVPVLLDVAFKSNVKQLAVFHHDPQHSDKFLDQLWLQNRSLYRTKDKKMDLFWAREGVTLAI